MTETGLARVPNGFGIAMQPANMQEAMQVAELLSSSQLCPLVFRGKPNDVLIACAMGARLGLDPFSALAGIAVVNGRATLWGDAMVAVAMQHPQFRGIKTVKSGEVAKGTFAVEVTALRDHGAGLIEYVGSFSQSDAKTAGLLGKAGPWTQYPARMVENRARAFALRNGFPDALAGILEHDEAESIGPVVVESAKIRPVKSKLVEVTPDVVTGEVIEIPADAVQSEAPAETTDNPTTAANVQPEATEREISVAEVQAVLREYTQEQTKELPTFTREATWEQVQAFAGRQFASPRELTQAERAAVVARFGGAV